MVRLSLAATLLAAAGITQAVRNSPAVLPGAYIVEYEDSNDSAAATFLSSIELDASKRVDLNYKLFRGASIQLKDLKGEDSTVARIAKMPAVKKIWPVKLYSVPEHTVHSVGIPRDDAGNVKRRGPETEADEFSPHLMTQVNMLRDKGIVGEGIKIAVVDTGTDYKHPALGGCFGPGCLVSFGADLVGDAFNGSNTPVPGPDPMDNCNGHGSHVAGIIAAQSDNPYGIIGAAQGVTLGSYRVFGCTGDVPDDVLIAAYNQAYEAGADIITASIGGPSGWSEDPWAVSVQRIVENGVPCTVSAGNDGIQGLFYASTAANGNKVTAIASADNILAPSILTNATFTVDGGDEQSFGYTPIDPSRWANVSLPLWAVSFDTTNPADGCEPYPDSTPDLSEKIVLVRRGTCTFVRKVDLAVEKGAKYIIFYNNIAGVQSFEASVPGVEGLAMVTAEQGATWIAALKAESEVVVSMSDPETSPQFLANFKNDLTPGLMSTYTSWGPTFEVDVKPQLAAPGGMIVSTYPRALGSYAVLSGTSMACPLAAAVYALIMNARGTKDPKTIENVLSATSIPKMFSNGTTTIPYLAPVPQQGSGMIQAYDAAYATSLLSVSSLSFNDTDNFQGVHNFSISNTGEEDVTYELSHVPALTSFTYADPADIYPDIFPNEVSDSYAKLSFAPSGSVKIPAGQRKIITVTGIAPSDLDAKRLPVYSGYISINGSDDTVLSLPYLGVAGSMHEATVLDGDATYMSDSFADELNPEPVAANHVFVLPPAGLVNDTAYRNKTALPMLVTTLAMGSPLVRVDVVALKPSKHVNTTDVFGTASIGQLADSPFLYEPRGLAKAYWDGQLLDGSYAPAGLYKFVVRALHIFGNADAATEYDMTETLPFRIWYSK